MTAYQWGQLVALSLLLVAVVGWCINMFALVTGCINFIPDSNYAFLLLRAVGVFVFPLGSILGLFF